MLGEGNPGVATTLHAALGQDDFATFIQEKAVETGVDLKRITLPPREGEAAAGTGVCMVLSGWTDAARTKADRCFVTHYGVVGAMTAADLDLPALCAADHVHISGFYNFKGLQEGGCAALASALRACREAGCTTSLCAQYDSSEEWGGIPDLCPLLDVVFVNEDEAAAISGLPVPGAAEAVPAAQWFNERGAALAVVTLGSEGAVATASGGESWHSPTVPLSAEQLADPTGAGDAFIAGFLMAWLGSGSAASALRWGCATGGANVQRDGAAQAIAVAELEAAIASL